MKIDNMSRSTLTYNLLKKGLDAASLRSEVTANNLANINTKNFKRSYVSFEDTLKEQSEGFKLKTTHAKHIKSEDEAGEYAEPRIIQDNETSMRQDGNNVDIEHEMVNQAANALMYNALISQVNGRLSMERTVINGR